MAFPHRILWGVTGGGELSDEYRLPGGRFKGWRLRDVPDDYLKRLIDYKQSVLDLTTGTTERRRTAHRHLGLFKREWDRRYDYPFEIPKEDQLTQEELDRFDEVK